MLSKIKAMEHFIGRALPRRVTDEVEALDSNGQPIKRTIFRRVGPEEEDRGHLYPLCHDGVNSFAHFGIGIGIYFTQLFVLAVVCFVCGMIMIAGGTAYAKSTFGMTHPTVPLSAACELTNVTATIGCANGASSCAATYRNNCELPYNAAAADLGMCFVLAVVITLSKFLESHIEQKLDESVQTVQDYSVEVLDPNTDADDPDEWFDFFSQFGKVMYITILRRNGKLTDMLLKKHKVSMKLRESGKFGSHLAIRREDYVQKYEEYRQLLSTALEGSYPVCRVYVTFEHEADQRNCMEALEVPDIEAMLDYSYNTDMPAKYRFRGKNILNIREPPEPDNIIWQNVEINSSSIWKKKVLSFFLSTALMICFWFLVMSASDQAFLLPLIVGLLDSLLPYIMIYITDLITPLSEGTRQSSIQMRLFAARLLLTTLIPYIQVQWHEVLSDEFVTQAFTVQISACFTAPLLALIDLPGLFNRHVFALWAETQEELNSYYNGSEWSLAEKYTGIARVLFVSLFYSLLVPISLLICSLAFVCIFAVDNFLLLRRWKTVSMLDSKIALRLRQQAVLAVAAHMYITFRFIYSWPMDEAFIHLDGTVEKVDKAPRWMFLSLHKEDWMSDGQLRIFLAYQTCVFIMAIVALYMWIIEPSYKLFYQLFFYNLKPADHFANIPFSCIPNMSIYYPLLHHEDKTYMSSYSKNVLTRHRPPLVEPLSLDRDDLSCYVPVALQPKVLSLVKYFGRDDVIDLESGFLGEMEFGNESAAGGVAVSTRTGHYIKAQYLSSRKKKPTEPFTLQSLVRDSRQALYDTFVKPIDEYYERKKRRQLLMDGAQGGMGGVSEHYGRRRDRDELGESKLDENEEDCLLLGDILDGGLEMSLRSKPHSEMTGKYRNGMRDPRVVPAAPSPQPTSDSSPSKVDTPINSPNRVVRWQQDEGVRNAGGEENTDGLGEMSDHPMKTPINPPPLQSFHSTVHKEEIQGTDEDASSVLAEKDAANTPGDTLGGEGEGGDSEHVFKNTPPLLPSSSSQHITRQSNSSVVNVTGLELLDEDS